MSYTLKAGLTGNLHHLNSHSFAKIIENPQTKNLIGSCRTANMVPRTSPGIPRALLKYTPS